MTGLDILLVDDDDDFAEVMAEYLRVDGHQVRIARSGAAATELALEAPPDVVLLDLGLPDMDGRDVAEVLRNRLSPLTPIIVLTGQRDPLPVAGTDLLLHKPVAPELFGGLIEYIRRRRLLR